MSARPKSENSLRTGSVLVIVLVGLLVVSLLAFALLRTVLIHQRQMGVLSGQQQGLWLAEAGIQRAIGGLADSPDYEGETWEVPADVLGASGSAEVSIEIEKPDGAPGEREIRVLVRLDDGSMQPNVYRREHPVGLPSRTAEAVERE